MRIDHLDVIGILFVLAKCFYVVQNMGIVLLVFGLLMILISLIGFILAIIKLQQASRPQKQPDSLPQKQPVRKVDTESDVLII